MDQVPLPFVVSQDSSYTTADDENVHISCPNESLRKRQATMHIFMNAGRGDLRDGYTALVCKGSRKGRRKAIEKLAWDTRVPMHFQKNAWVDTETMVDMAKAFVQHVRNKHDGLWVLLYCDNLSAHVSEIVKATFAAGKVFLCYFPPNCTESVQPIDAAYGRSMRCQIGNILDKWLMQESNLAQWEGKMSASERRVLLSNLVGEANEKVLNNDDMRVNCFVRTGCLLQYEPSDSDNLIKPQGVRSKIIIPPTYAETNIGAAIEYLEPATVVTPEQDSAVEISLYDDTAGDALDNDASNLIVYEEGDAELVVNENLGQMAVHESDDEIDLGDLFV